MKFLISGIFMFMLTATLNMFYWLMESPVPPIDLTSITQKLMDIDGNAKTTFRAGETLYIRTSQVILRSGPRMVTQVLFDEDRQLVAVQYAPTVALNPLKGFNPGSNRAFALPANLPPGNYSRRVIVTYSLNPLRNSESYTIPPVRFAVVK